MNQLLQSSLAEYGFSGDKVNRMIEGAKAFEIWYNEYYMYVKDVDLVNAILLLIFNKFL